MIAFEVAISHMIMNIWQVKVSKLLNELAKNINIELFET